MRATCSQPCPCVAEPSLMANAHSKLVRKTLYNRAIRGRDSQRFDVRSNPKSSAAAG